MPLRMSKILGPKRLLLWKKTMLSDVSYQDLAVVDEIAHGVALTGDVPFAGIFEPAFKCAELTVEDLRARSKADRLAAFFASRSSGDPEIDSAVLEKTLQEVQCGWARGPLDLASLPSSAVISRRFVLRQSEKSDSLMT